MCAEASWVASSESRHELLYYWLGAFLFVVGSLLDILDGALARASGKGTPFGAFLDSTTDRVGEGLMLGAIALAIAPHPATAAVTPKIMALVAPLLPPHRSYSAGRLALLSSATSV